MANKETVTKKIVTGVGELTGFISLFKPSTRYDKDGTYQANIILPKEEGERIAAIIKDVRTEQFKTYGKGTKVTDLTQCSPLTIVDEETGEETPDEEGRYIFKTKAKAFVKDGKPTAFIQVMDSKLRPMTNASVGAGTKAKLGAVLSGYCVAGKTGVSVKLKMVQILDLVKYKGGENPEDFGFTAEDGFEGTEENFAEVKETSTEAEDEVIEGEEDF